MPDELSGHANAGERRAVAQKFWIRGASFRDGILHHLEALAAELNVAAMEPTSTARVSEFLQMLAKIAHAFAIAEMGLDSFSPFLAPIVCKANTSNSLQFIGGLQYTEPAQTALHELSFCTHTWQQPDVVVVRIRLLASL